MNIKLYIYFFFGKSQQGKSINAFIESKNSLNENERDDSRDIPKNHFYKAFEIYIHATKYDTNEAFGCLECPREIEKGETEEDLRASNLISLMELTWVAWKMSKMDL